VAGTAGTARPTHRANTATGVARASGERGRIICLFFFPEKGAEAFVQMPKGPRTGCRAELA
jgi:hypothetical protein